VSASGAICACGRDLPRRPVHNVAGSPICDSCGDLAFGTFREELAEINTGRAVFGLAPIKHIPIGERKDCATCPLAIALDGRVDVFILEVRLVGENKRFARDLAEAWGTWSPDRAAGLVWLPRILECFVRWFDNGNYPQLEARA
jgi:hypothetical protein